MFDCGLIIFDFDALLLRKLVPQVMLKLSTCLDSTLMLGQPITMHKSACNTIDSSQQCFYKNRYYKALSNNKTISRVLSQWQFKTQATQ